MNLKHCRVCGLNLPPAEFHIDRSSPDGLHLNCKVCRRIHAKQKAAEKRRSRHERPEYYADSREGRAAFAWQRMLNGVPALSRGNLSPVVRSCWEVAAWAR